MTAPGIVVRPMRADDVGTVADLHRRAFPAYVSTKLGAGYCRRMLRAFEQAPGTWIDVAVDEDRRIIGFLVAAPPPTQRAVERALLPWAALNAYRHPAELARNVRRAIARLGGRRTSGGTDVRAGAPAERSSSPPDPVASPAPSDPATVRVVLVAVDADARGRGGADALLGAFASTAFERGHRVADLSVDTVNAAAHRAYARNGWRADETGAHFHLDLSGPAAP